MLEHLGKFPDVINEMALAVMIARAGGEITFELAEYADAVRGAAERAGNVISVRTGPSGGERHFTIRTVGSEAEAQSVSAAIVAETEALNKQIAAEKGEGNGANNG